MTTKTGNLQQQSENMNRQTRDYAMRVECCPDSDAAHSLLKPWLINWTETRVTCNARDGRCHVLRDMKILFSVIDSAPTLVEMRWLLDAIPDLHVGAQSLDDAAIYTEDRIHFDELEIGRPTCEIIDIVKQFLAVCGEDWADTARRLEEAAQVLDAAVGDDVD